MVSNGVKTNLEVEDIGWKGSQQRCLLLTSNGATELQNSLIKIIGQRTVEDLCT